ncbi:MAG: Ig-like domain-containing protein [Ruminococcus sp.]|nr:Ig-like domain-containing protein [Ruminococcus sp.]
MKKIISVIITLMLMLSFAAVSVSAAPKLSQTSYTLTKGYQILLKVTGNSGAVQWGSSDTSIATVNAGTVVGKAVGTATISAVVDGVTLRCNVKVVATKISADKTAVTVEKGKYATVTLTVTGDKSGLTLSSGNSAVAKGSWSGAKWDGNKITLRITGVAAGSSTVTVYRKNYKSDYYQTITVTVPGAAPAEPAKPAVTEPTLKVSQTKVNVNAGAAAAVIATATGTSTLSAYSTDTDIATIAAGTVSGNNRTYNITGVKAGTTTVRIYDRVNQANFADITVTVTGTAYYVIGTTRPATTGTDQVVTFQKDRLTYYMLVPMGYDEADVNTAIAKNFKTYEYYTVYSEAPTFKAYTDSVRNFTKTNTNIYNPYNPYATTASMYSPRYVLVPRNFDQVKLDTAVSKYLGTFEYYTIYNVRPTETVRTDTVQSWRIVDETGTQIARYVLLPVNYSQDRLNDLKASDVENNQDFTLYAVTETFPTNPGVGNQVFSWRTTDGKTHYMVVPIQNCDFLKRNDAVYKDTAVYCYFNAYTTAPKVSDEAREYVVSMYIQSGNASKLAYILVDKTDAEYEQKLQNIQSGTYYFTPQGTFANTSSEYWA